LNFLKKLILRRFDALIAQRVERACEQKLALVPQLVDFANSLPEKKQSYHDRSRNPLEEYSYFCALRARLVELGVKVEDSIVDIVDFERWLEEYSELTANYMGLGDVMVQKCLEHYLSFRYLNLSAEDVFLDVAAAGSPFVDILSKRLAINAYRLDLSYPEGVHGRNIGADAGDTKLPTSFASAMALHCAFECFMGDNDIRFVKEASRVLKPGGRCVILPLYLDETYFVATSPYCNQDEVVIDSGALKLWRDDGYHVPFSRHYSPQSFMERIYSALPDDLESTLYFVRNLPEVMQHFSGQRVYCYFVFCCEKRGRHEVLS